MLTHTYTIEDKIKDNNGESFSGKMRQLLLSSL